MTVLTKHLWLLPFLLFLQAIAADVTESHVSDANSSDNEVPTDDVLFNPDEIIRKYIVDPMPLPDYNDSHTSFSQSYEVKLWDLQLSGLKKASLTKVEMEFMNRVFTVIVTIPHLQVDGLYNMSGRFVFMNVAGDGIVQVNITNLRISMACDLIRITNGLLEVEKVAVDVQNDDLNVYLEKLSESAILFDQIASYVYHSALGSAIPKVQDDILKRLNEHLAVADFKTIRSTSDILFEDWFGRARAQIIEQNLDPFPLPDEVRNIHLKMAFIEFDEEIRIHNGTLYGLSSIIPTEPIRFIYENYSLVLEAGIGLTNLTTQHLWRSFIFGIRRKGNFGFTINRIDGSTRLRLPLKRNAGILIDKLEITRIDQAVLNIEGLGALGSLLEIMTNILTNSLKSNLVASLPPPLLAILQKEIANSTAEYTDQVADLIAMLIKNIP